MHIHPVADFPNETAIGTRHGPTYGSCRLLAVCVARLVLNRRINRRLLEEAVICREWLVEVVVRVAYAGTTPRRQLWN